MVEAKNWKSLQDGAEREIKSRQDTKLITQEKIESINVRIDLFYYTIILYF
jgi:hypothetical protein